MKFKSNMSFGADIVDAAIKRLKDLDNFDFRNIDLKEQAVSFIRKNEYYDPYIPMALDICSSFKKNMNLKNLKFFINLNNARILKLQKENSFYENYIFSLLKELENEALNLESLTEEKQIKFFYGSSFAFFNNFSRDKSYGLQFSNKDFLIDHKTKESFKEQEMCSVIKNLGITLPIIDKTLIPIIDIEIINEETTSGDFLFELEKSNPMNLIEKNKVFNYSVAFKKHDKKRKYAREKSELTLLFKLGAKLPVNNLKVMSASLSAFEIEEISYIDSEGNRIKINEYEIEGTFESNFLFKQIETDLIFLKISQYNCSGSSEIPSRFLGAQEAILENMNLISGSLQEVEVIQADVFDISLNEVELNLITFETKGIFRSEYKEISNAYSLNLTQSSAIPSLIELKDSYLEDYLILSDEVLIENYLGLKVFAEDGGILINETIPLVDNKYKQTEYIEPVGNIMRFKLFPLMNGIKAENVVLQIDLTEECVTTEEIIEEKEDFEIEEENLEVELIVTDDSYTADSKAELLEGINDFVQESMEMEELDYIITQWVIQDLVRETDIINGLMDNIINGNIGYGSINIKDFIRDDGLGTLTGIPMDIYWIYEYQQDIDTGMYSVRLIDPSIGIPLNRVDFNDIGRAAKINVSGAYFNLQEKLNVPLYNSYVNNQMYQMYSSSPNWQTISLDVNAHNKEKEEIVASNNRSYESSSSTITTEICEEFYKITFKYPHELKIGDRFEFYYSEKDFYLSAVVGKIIDDYIILIPKNYIGNIDASLLGIELEEYQFYKVPSNANNIEVYEEAKKLAMGRDYQISPDNGSNWYNSIPLDVKISILRKKAKAGNFLIKYNKVNHNKFYIAKYFVAPQQWLSKKGEVVLNNNRIELKEPLSTNEGIVSAIFVIRNGFKNKYLSPVIYEYNMYGYEEEPLLNKKGLVYNKYLTNRNLRKPANVN
tara:strand:- start:6594 stop:9428 length:2835 start_codon:yes stop_codon:yes gene_type:complete